MICEGCRYATANNRIYDAESKRSWDFCEECAPPVAVVIPWIAKYRGGALPVYHCADCGGVAETGRCPIVKDPAGELHHYHRGCTPPAGWVVVPTVTITAVKAATPEVAAALGMPYEEPPPRVKERLKQLRREQTSAGLQRNPKTGGLMHDGEALDPEWDRLCNCELHDRAWDTNLGRCRTCGRRYEDGH